MIKYIRFIIALLILPTSLFAQSPKIEITIDNYTDGEVYIAYYYGKYQYIQDTLRSAEGSNTFLLTADSLLHQGMYILATKNKNWFEFIVDGDQHFKMHTHVDDLVLNMKIKGHQENDWFFTFLQDQYLLRTKLDSIKLVKSNAEDINQITELEKEIESTSNLLNNYQTSFINDHANSFVAKIFKASKEPIVPDNVSNSKTPDAAYNYFVKHFWDEFDLADGKMVYTPLMFKKMDRFFNKILAQSPDTLIHWSDWFIAQTKPNKEMYKFAIWYLTNSTQTSNIMGHDAVFVHLVNKYYKTGEAYWANEKVIKSISESADQLSRILIGKVSPDLALTDTSGAFVTLHKVEADYTVLYFWDTDCGHCLTETPKLQEIYKQTKDQGVEVLAVQIEQDEVTWKQQIKTHGFDWINAMDSRNWNNMKSVFAITATPKVYVLDKDKKIIYKNIAVVQLWDILAREGLTLKKPQNAEQNEADH